MCPAAKYGFSRRGDVGIAPYAKTGGRTRIAGVGDGVPCVLPKFDKKPPAVYTRLKDAAINGRRLVTAPRGGDAVFFVLTFHILGHSISIRIQKLKSKNRHSDK